MTPTAQVLTEWFGIRPAAGRVCAALERVGYFPRTLGLGAGAAGGAHQRKRVWLLATDAARPQGRSARQPWEALEGAPAGRHVLGRPEDSGLGLEHFGPEAIGRHLRGLDGVPDELVDRVRSALGDAVVPLIPFLILRALIRGEEGAFPQPEAHAAELHTEGVEIPAFLRRLADG